MSERPSAPSMARANWLFALGVATLVALALGNVFIRRQIERALDLREHSYNIMQAATRLNKALTDVEFGVRGFAVSQSQADLERVNAGTRDVGPASPACAR